jgi:serine O-acetyltransferase
MFKRIVNEIDSVFDRDPAARSRLEVLLCYPGLHAILLYRLSNWLWRYGLKLPGRVLSYFARFLTGIDIHPGATIGKRFFIDHGMGGVSPGQSAKGSLRHPQIGNNVIIGAGAHLLGPIRVADNARIGSNAVVVKDVNSGDTMVGVPARPVVDKAAAKKEAHFDAYGTGIPEDADPVMKLVSQMQNEIGVLKRRITELEADDATLLGSAKQWENK